MNKNLDKTSILLLILISISFVAFALLLILIVQVFFKEINFENASYFGAFIGGLTSLAAIVLLYKTYQSQKNELQLAREIATKQEKTMRDQKVENSLFNMLSALSETVKLMDGEITVPSFRDGQREIQLTGRAYLRKASEELIKKLK
ncbi:MAG: hypothetical protein ORN54_09750, partial [Cyclobacteriaceae bacterium]|nr:hypothetical protein [Cyclobacteriaceae bacterium]